MQINFPHPMYEFAKHDFRLPLLSSWELCLSGLLRSEKW